MFGEIARGCKPFKIPLQRGGRQCAGDFINPQFADTIAGVGGSSRLCADEPFARREFRLPLRGRDCRLPRDFVAFSAGLPLWNEYFAVVEFRRGTCKKTVS